MRLIVLASIDYNTSWLLRTMKPFDGLSLRIGANYSIEFWVFWYIGIQNYDNFVLNNSTSQKLNLYILNSLVLLTILQLVFRYGALNLDMERIILFSLLFSISFFQLAHSLVPAITATRSLSPEITPAPCNCPVHVDYSYEDCNVVFIGPPAMAPLEYFYPECPTTRTVRSTVTCTDNRTPLYKGIMQTNTVRATKPLCA